MATTTQQKKARVVTKPSVSGLWAMTKLDPNAEGNIECPFCGWQATFGDVDEQKNAVGHHLDQEHETKLEFARLHWTELGWDAYTKLKDIEARETLEEFNPTGMDVTDDFEDFDYLYVADEIKDKVRGRGGELRWVTAKNVDRYKDRGMVMVERGDADMPNQHSHEDTSARANELVLMEVPKQLKEKRNALKREMVRRQGETVARQENRENSQSDLGRNAYDYYRRQGMPHENAMRLSRTVEKRVDSGDAALPTPVPGENRYTHRR